MVVVGGNSFWPTGFQRVMDHPKAMPRLKKTHICSLLHQQNSLSIFRDDFNVIFPKLVSTYLGSNQSSNVALEVHEIDGLYKKAPKEENKKKTLKLMVVSY